MPVACEAEMDWEQWRSDLPLCYDRVCNVCCEEADMAIADRWFKLEPARFRTPRWPPQHGFSRQVSP